MLKTSIVQIATDTPMTEVAVTRIKKLIAKMASDSAGAMRGLIVDVAGKTAAEPLKSKMWGLSSLRRWTAAGAADFCTVTVWTAGGLTRFAVPAVGVTRPQDLGVQIGARTPATLHR